MKVFKKRNKGEIDKVEDRFQRGLDLVKDLDKKEFNRFISGLTLGWQSYDCIRKVKTIDEKENGDIYEAEREAEKEKFSVSNFKEEKDEK